MMRLLLPLLILASSLVLPLSAQPASEARTALVIGVGNYADRYFSRLQAPENDARAMAGKLESLGFTVTMKLNATRREMMDATDVFGETLAKKHGVGLFYFSGHGSIKLDEADPNFLIPVGTAISSREDLPQEAFNVQRVANRMKEAGNRLNLVFLDACRNNALPSRAKDATGGLAAMRGASGLMFFFATQPNQIALEDADKRRSLFTDALLAHMATPGLSFMDMMADVTAATERLSVEEGGSFKQSPFMSGTLSGRFSFQPAGRTTQPGIVTGAEPQRLVREGVAGPLSHPPTPVVEPATPRSVTDQPPAPLKVKLPPAGYFELDSLFDGTPYDSYNQPSRVAILKDAQAQLKSRNLYRDTVDGGMGPGTQQAIIVWQQRQNLAPSGKLDNETLASLGLVDVPEIPLPKPASAPSTARVSPKATPRPAQRTTPATPVPAKPPAQSDDDRFREATRMLDRR